MYWQVIVLNILELVACITGFLYWRKVKDTYWRWFPVYLATIVLIEVTAEYFLYEQRNAEVSLGIYQYFGIPLEFLFFYWLFYRYFDKKNRWPLYSAAIYIACWLLDIFYLGHLSLYFESVSYGVGTILLLILLFQFFMQFARSNDVLKYRSSMMFWVALGIILFYMGTLPFYELRNTLYRMDDKTFFFVYWYIQFGLNYLMYILFVLSFIWGKPK
ncbi:MAG TPA: hypothetical protein VFI06_01075 [Chitinophagaceae bacterium]|nr:hypothetical protein [Chitinophagaceae bacterium]